MTKGSNGRRNPIKWKRWGEKIVKQRSSGQNGGNNSQQAHKNNKLPERKQMSQGSLRNKVVNPWEL